LVAGGGAHRHGGGRGTGTVDTDRPAVGIDIHGTVAEALHVDLAVAAGATLYAAVAVQLVLRAHQQHGRGQGAGGALDGGLVGVLGGVDEARQRHRGEDAEDHDHHHQFDQGKAFVVSHLSSSVTAKPSADSSAAGTAAS